MNFALLGPPGSGKGSYGRLIANSLSAELLASSAILHQSKLLNHEEVTRGRLVDDSVVSDALFKHVSSSIGIGRKFVVDGFPRTIHQVEIMKTTWPPNLQMQAAVSLDMPRAVCKPKLLGRRMCTRCGGNYNVANVQYGQYTLPPNLPEQCECNQLHWVTRQDDSNEEVVETRLNLYFDTIPPVLEYFESRNSLFRFSPQRGHHGLVQSFQEWLDNFHSG